MPTDPLDDLPADAFEDEATATPAPTAPAEGDAPAEGATAAAEGKQGADVTTDGGDVTQAEDVTNDATDGGAQPGEPAGEATEDAPASPPGEGEAKPKPAGGVAPTAQQQRATRKTEVRAALRDLSTKLTDLKTAGEVDPFVATGLQTDAMLLQNELAEINNAEVEALQQQQHVESQWVEWGKKNPEMSIARSREIFDEEFGKAFKEESDLRPDEDPAILERVAAAVATRAWKQRVALSRGQKSSPARQPAKPAIPKPTGPIGKGAPSGTTTIPRAGAGGPIPPRTLSAEEQFAAEVGDSIKSFP